jgi:hypothetical protein
MILAVAGALLMVATTQASAIVIVDTVNPASPQSFNNNGDSYSYSHNILTNVVPDGSSSAGVGCLPCLGE